MFKVPRKPKKLKNKGCEKKSWDEEKDMIIERVEKKAPAEIIKIDSRLLILANALKTSNASTPVVSSKSFSFFGLRAGESTLISSLFFFDILLTKYYQKS